MKSKILITILLIGFTTFGNVNAQVFWHINFDDLSWGTELTNQYASMGVVFSGHDIFGDRPIAVGGFENQNDSVLYG